MANVLVNISNETLENYAKIANGGHEPLSHLERVILDGTIVSDNVANMLVWDRNRKVISKLEDQVAAEALSQLEEIRKIVSFDDCPPQRQVLRIKKVLGLED